MYTTTNCYMFMTLCGGDRAISPHDNVGGGGGRAGISHLYVLNRPGARLDFSINKVNNAPHPPDQPSMGLTEEANLSHNPSSHFPWQKRGRDTTPGYAFVSQPFSHRNGALQGTLYTHTHKKKDARLWNCWSTSRMTWIVFLCVVNHSPCTP